MEGTAVRAILAGGGTGGHVIPALAIAQELRARHAAEIKFIGTARGLETKLVPAAGFELALIEVGALKSVSFATRLSTLCKLPGAVLRSRRILRQFRPDVVIGVGGYASGPAVLAAELAGVPTLLFEPNRVPGFANRVVARWASAAAVQFEETRQRFRNAQVTGTPVRKEFFDIPPRPAGAPPTLLVFGGSQGAAALNRVMMESAAALQQAGVSVIHQTGERDYNQVQAACQQSGSSAEVIPFIDRMPEAFARADLLLCRSGASTVAEVAAAGKPAIFVPFPRAADDHQRRNAEALVEAGAAVLIPEAELTSAHLTSTVSELLTDKKRLGQMAAAARGLSHPNAAQDIAAMAARLAAVAK
jgi:UDP-N-acetylglucosamine--N-acetylmuramyl-(pentapeptide) pyrophosphoryl-undecaprenol N-acetylglucosamine transferase